MKESVKAFKNSKTSKIIFSLSIFASVFWCLGQVINVYSFALLGAIFEILWLPMLASLLFLPIISVVLWVKEKFNIKSLYLYSIIIILIVAIALYTGFLASITWGRILCDFYPDKGMGLSDA
jgi:hypothetical protein